MQQNPVPNILSPGIQAIGLEPPIFSRPDALQRDGTHPEETAADQSESSVIAKCCPLEPPLPTDVYAYIYIYKAIYIYISIYMYTYIHADSDHVVLYTSILLNMFFYIRTYSSSNPAFNLDNR